MGAACCNLGTAPRLWEVPISFEDLSHGRHGSRTEVAVLPRAPRKNVVRCPAPSPVGGPVLPTVRVIRRVVGARLRPAGAALPDTGACPPSSRAALPVAGARPPSACVWLPVAAARRSSARAVLPVVVVRLPPASAALSVVDAGPPLVDVNGHRDTCPLFLLIRKGLRRRLTVLAPAPGSSALEPDGSALATGGRFLEADTVATNLNVRARHVGACAPCFADRATRSGSAARRLAMATGGVRAPVRSRCQ